MSVTRTLLVCALWGCQAYDAGLLGDRPVRLPPAPMPGTGEFVCGDGVVSDREKCDVGILPGMPGACPAECPAVAMCTRSVLAGGACDTECVVEALPCANGDGCCPAGCDNAGDDDCSALCGNGRVDPDEGETCEVGDPLLPCAMDCDDGDPCTGDVTGGSPENCNVVCEHPPVTALDPNDACCPVGANANTDSDCKAKCGNGVREGDEECDGSENCGGDCTLMMTDELTRCLDTYGTDPCMECSCMNCIGDVLDCFESGEAQKDTWCADVVACGRANQCAGDACYCGTATTLECTILPAGPCVPEILAAAEAMDSINVELRKVDPMYAVGRATLLNNCSVTNCPAVCP